MAKITVEQTIAYLKEKKYKELHKLLNKTHYSIIADILNQLDEENATFIFSLLHYEKAADVLLEIHEELRQEIIEHIKKERLVNIVDEMQSDEATDLLNEMRNDISNLVLERLEKESSEQIKKLLDYGDETAGGLMQTEIIAINYKRKRDDIIHYIRFNKQEIEKLYYVFVVNDNRQLIGLLEISKLLLADKESTAESLMEKDIISVNVFKDQEEVANIFRKYDIYILPVVDDNNVLIGRITVDDIIDVIDEEASEDAYKMVGLEKEDKVFTSPLNSMRKRLPWLVLNLFTALTVSSVVGIFETTIARLSFLAVLMPIVAGLGGNSGTQTLTVIIRGIAMGELTIYNTFKAITKEVTVGILNGAIIGTLGMLIAFWLKKDIMLGVVLGIAMITNMFIASLVGSIIPLVMKKLNIDPALASSVIITMLTDIGGFASFLGLASIML